MLASSNVWALNGAYSFRSCADVEILSSELLALLKVLWTDWLHHGTLRVASMRVRLHLIIPHCMPHMVKEHAIHMGEFLKSILESNLNGDP